MVQHAPEIPLSRPTETRHDTLTTDTRRLRSLSRELRQTVGAKREKVQTDLAALLAESRSAVAERRSRLPKPDFQPASRSPDDLAYAISFSPHRPFRKFALPRSTGKKGGK